MNRVPPPDAPIGAVIFDIDGTLITTGGAGGVAWRKAFEEVHGVPVDIARVTESGMVDHEVATVALATVLDRQPSEREVAEVTGPYLEHLPDAVARSEGYRVKPGIVDLLERLAAAGYPLGITSGNIEPAAKIKLERGDLNRFFTFGGYGSDSTDRTELTRRAIERGTVVAGEVNRPGRGPGLLTAAEFIAVGDTPRDVTAAHGAGIRVVAVATGLFDRETLGASDPEWNLQTVESGFPV
ncbi:MAG: HAD family hydrolase [Solirubrobacterales bacterium]|nr:HAD family hydrolase [Solirubrobacterales bacterium]